MAEIFPWPDGFPYSPTANEKGRTVENCLLSCTLDVVARNVKGVQKLIRNYYEKFSIFCAKFNVEISAGHQRSLSEMPYLSGNVSLSQKL